LIIFCSLYVVLRYQNEETKRAIIRLEQGAHSYMQRAIASHGAFAVLYGRHSKHYIKKPEVFQCYKSFPNLYWVGFIFCFGRPLFLVFPF